MYVIDYVIYSLWIVFWLAWLVAALSRGHRSGEYPTSNHPLPTFLVPFDCPTLGP